MNRHPKLLKISPPILEVENDVWRVSALVNDEPVWFEGSGANARASVEAFAGLFLLPAMSRGIPLRVEAPLDREWLDNIHRQQEIFQHWWNYPIIPIESEVRASADQPKQERTALFFTCGVDSFYSLLHSDYAVDALVTVHGYDIHLSDRSHAGLVMESVAEVARKSGKRAIQVRTNVREHRWFKKPSWVKTHGAGLAAIGHLLGPDYNRWLISSSNNRVYDVPNGSHWDTDPLWSSSNVRFVHVADDVWRNDKVAAISRNDVAQQHLTVCYNYVKRGNQRNCSRCEKCVRTMLLLKQQGRLHEFKVFAIDRGLAALIDDVGWIADFRIPVYRRYIENEPDPAIRQALERLIARSNRLRLFLVKLQQWAARRLSRLRRFFTDSAGGSNRRA